MIDKEKIYWQFIRDLKILGDDVKSLVLYGGCRWGEPSPIPAIVERLSKLDWGDVASSLMYMKSIGMTRDDFKNDVKDIYNYHLDCSQDLAYSDIDRVALYAKWLNRFILICGKFGMYDVIPLSKQDEPQRYSKELIDFFKGNIDLIKEIEGKDRGTVATKVTQWSKIGKCKVLDFGSKKQIATLLIKDHIVEPKQKDIDKDIDSFRKKF